MLLLDRAAPGVSRLLAKVIDTAYNYLLLVRNARPDVVTMRVGETSFRLRLVAGNEMAHRDYRPLALEGGVYEPVATACLTRVLQCLPEPVFMDIGAFIGYFTCYVAALLRDQRPVWAVESNPVFCNAIRHAMRLNGFSRVRVVQAALSDRPRMVAIDDTTVAPARAQSPQRYVTEAITLDELCAREAIAPTVVKIDVHGAEGQVLQGMSRLLRESIKVILLELHPLDEYRPHSPDVTRVELLDRLEQFDFSVFYMAGHRSENRSNMRAHLGEGRFAYVPITARNRELLLFDRHSEMLILASKVRDVSEMLGPSIDLAIAVR